MANQPHFEIEKGIARAGRGRSEKYPWSLMSAGDSFFVPGGKQPSMASVACAAKRAGKGSFTTSAVDGGVRVWRVA